MEKKVHLIDKDSGDEILELKPMSDLPVSGGYEDFATMHISYDEWQKMMNHKDIDFLKDDFDVIVNGKKETVRIKNYVHNKNGIEMLLIRKVSNE